MRRTLFLIGLCGLVGGGCVWADELSAELVSVATSLASHAQLDVKGEEAHFAQGGSTIPIQFDTFTLKFDRPSKRFRLIYSRFIIKSRRIDVQAWGTLDCLNILRTDRRAPGYVEPTLKTCAHLDALYSTLSGFSQGEGTTEILRGEVENNLLERRTTNRSTQVELKRTPTNVLIEGSDVIQGKTLGTWKYWLSADSSSIEHYAADNQGERVRANYEHSMPALSDSDFDYKPDEETLAFADFKQNPKGPARTVLESAASKGSVAAKLALKSQEPNASGLAYGIGINDPEAAWENSTELGKLGVASMYTVQAQLLVRMPDAGLKYLPGRYQTMNLEQRQVEAAKLMWAGVQGCDAEAMNEVSRGFLRGLDSEPQKLAELETIRKNCDQRMTAPELIAAGDLYKGVEDTAK